MDDCRGVDQGGLRFLISSFAYKTHTCVTSHNVFRRGFGAAVEAAVGCPRELLPRMLGLRRDSASSSAAASTLQQWELRERKTSRPRELGIRENDIEVEVKKWALKLGFPT
eukprot:2714398-Amphidinium_carterae.1